MTQDEKDERDIKVILNAGGTLSVEQKEQVKQEHTGYECLAEATGLKEMRVRTLLHREPVSAQLRELKREPGIKG